MKQKGPDARGVTKADDEVRKMFANVDVIELVQCVPTRQNKIEVKGRWAGK